MTRLTILCAILGLAPSPAHPQSGDSDLKPYQAAAGIQGNLASVGSDTLNGLMTLWGEKFKQYHPGVNFQIEGKGSNTAPAALTAGTSQLAPMSRVMKPQEIDAFEARYGYKPTEIRVAVDSLAVFVHKDNPIKSLSLDQLDAIFSKVRRRGGRAIPSWGDLGLTGEWANRPISLYGRNSASGTYVFFKEHVLKTGDFKDEVKEQPGSASVVLGVSEDRFGIGYSGVGYVTGGIRAVPLSEKTGTAGIPPTRENAYSGEYPLTRFLYVYVNRPAEKACPPLVREFVRMICSKEGQEIVAKEAFFPVPGAVAKEDVKKVD